MDTETVALIILAGGHIPLEWTCVPCYTSGAVAKCKTCEGNVVYRVYYPTGMGS